MMKNKFITILLVLATTFPTAYAGDYASSNALTTQTQTGGQWWRIKIMDIGGDDYKNGNGTCEIWRVQIDGNWYVANTCGGIIPESH